MSCNKRKRQMHGSDETRNDCMPQNEKHWIETVICTDCSSRICLCRCNDESVICSGSAQKSHNVFLEMECSKKMDFSFYDVPCQDLARGLLGKVLVRKLPNGVILKGRIVETECYLGGEDRASHSYNGKVTPRNTPMYMQPGTIYVYFTYGMYFCFNISSQGDGAAVLIRAVDPLEGMEYMNVQRINKRQQRNKKLCERSSFKCIAQRLKSNELCNGPGKLCISFNIDVNACNKQDLCVWDGLWIEADSKSDSFLGSDMVTSTRIGIDSVGGEWVSKPLRFYLYGNPSVSRRDKLQEEKRLNTG